MKNDPYKYFRVEAREILDGLAQGILQLEKGAPASDVVARLLRLAHTLKGAARVVKQPGIAELAHAGEGILTSHRETGRPLSKQQGSELLRLLDEIASLLSALEPASDIAPSGSARPPAEEPLDTLRVESREIDSLLRILTEAGVHLGTVRKGLGASGRVRDLTILILDLLAPRLDENGAETAPGIVRARTVAEELRSSFDHLQRSLAVDIERVEGELAELRDVAHRLRLIPVQTMFPTLERSVRDAAQMLGKRVAFMASGGEVRLDANMLASLKDALMHVVRNSVAHGVETEAERVALGKSPTGQVRLEVERRGSRVVFVCRDDGRGIDVEAVRKAAMARGLVPASESKALPPNEVIALLHAGGLTTANDVTELSGRGIGLDVVRATTARLKGEMSIRSEPGLGATVEIQVPISIASLHGLIVEAGGALAAIPLDAIRETLSVRDADVSRSAARDSILHEGKAIPFLPLHHILQRSGSANRSRRSWSVVVVQTGDRRVAIGVDRLLGTSNIVMRSLPDDVEADPAVSGASLDAEGNPQLVLDPSCLVGAAERGRGAAPDAPVPQRNPILVIDDSLTTRMLEQSILESAGYEVDVAVSAEEALSKSRDRRYSLFIVDVEMPGMNGFEFVTQTQSDNALREIPAILVTSRNAPEDRRRGEQAGARAYIVKGEFDQGQFMQTIRNLIGSS